MLLKAEVWIIAEDIIILDDFFEWDQTEMLVQFCTPYNGRQWGIVSRESIAKLIFGGEPCLVNT